VSLYFTPFADSLLLTAERLHVFSNVPAVIALLGLSYLAKQVSCPGSTALAVFGPFLLILISLVTERIKHFFMTAICFLTGNGGSPSKTSKEHDSKRVPCIHFLVQSYALYDMP
jgi:hypothetical protein